jgi:hypothetical protein
MPRSARTGDKPLSAAVRAAACGEIADALQVLWAQSRPGDEAVHQVRKDLKKARAALRLLRDAVGEAAYSRENIELRDAARPLSALRDAVVGLELARELIAKEKSPARRAMLQELRRKLHADRLQSREGRDARRDRAGARARRAARRVLARAARGPGGVARGLRTRLPQGAQGAQQGAR